MNYWPFPPHPLPDAVKWPARFFFWGLVLLIFGLMLHPLVDPDVYIHLRDGRHWVETGLRVQQDPFTYTASDQPFEKVEWLFRIGIYLLWKTGGLSLLIIAKAAVITLAFLLFAGLMYRRWPQLGLTAGLLGLSLLALWTRVAPERPQIFTYLLLPLVIHLLEDFRLDDTAGAGSPEQRLWYIPVLVVPWANLHPGFVVLFAFLGVHSLDHLLAYWRQKDPRCLKRFFRLCLVTLVCFLAGALNPLGFGIYSFVFHALANQQFMLTIVEWMPPELQRKPVFFLTLAIVWVVQLFSFRRTRASDFFLLLLFSYLSLKSRRNIPFFLLAAMPAFAGHLHYLQETWFPGRAFSYTQKRRGFIMGQAVLGIILGITVATGYSFRLGQFPDYHPTQGLAWIQARNLQGRLFAPLHWGGYIGWKTHGSIQVFMDGRLPTFAGKTYTDYGYIIYGDPQHCLAMLDAYDIEILLVSPQNYYSLFEQLNQSGRWALVWWDHVSQVFVRRQGINRQAALENEYLSIDPNATPYLNPSHPEQSRQEIERAATAAPHSFLPLFFKGDQLFKQGRLDEAHEILRQVNRQTPKHPHTLYDLGLIALHKQQWAEAEHYLKKALHYYHDKPSQAQACLSLALLLKQSSNRRGQALRYARQALHLMPGWPPAVQMLRELEGL
ncbi:tetratricopeptide repeat protein [candidate division FCPU426 bacterium]|nr:tetratricopeptide repeat protein [candidate division FCPU426 bacterium]